MEKLSSQQHPASGCLQSVVFSLMFLSHLWGLFPHILGEHRGLPA